MTRLTVDASVRLVPDAASPFFRVPALQKVPHLVHAVTRRRLPGAGAEFDLKRGDSAAARARLAQQLGIEHASMVWLDPDESGDVRFISEQDRGRGATDWSSRVRRASGLVTGAFNLFLATLYNDNLVVLLFDPRWYNIGLVNISPNEATSEALEEAVQLMAARGGSDPVEMTALLGPSVGPCCFTFPDPALAGARGQTNLWDLARGGLLKAGLRRDQILNPRVCTACTDTEFFSRDADGGNGGAGAIVFGVQDDGALYRQINRRRAAAKELQPAPAETREMSLLEEERRLNALVRCPYGQNKVYVRSVFDGQSVETSKPEIALRCAVMAAMGHAAGGYNIVTREQIVTVCCGDYALCLTYQELAKRQKR